MKTLFGATVILLLFALASQAQSTHDFLVGGGVDVIKTDLYKVFDKAQIGLEANYFIQRKFAAGAGVELWTRQKNSFVIGTRYYIDDAIFFRLRGLIGENDIALGAGWAKPLSEKVRLEIMGDYYFSGAAFGLRAGIGYVIRQK